MLRLAIAASPVKHPDETGLRIGGETMWLHSASTPKLTLYRAATHSGSLPEDLAGIVAHDHFKPYYQFEGVLHALCNAHHLRKLQALIRPAGKDSWGRTSRRIAHNLLSRLDERGSDVLRFLSNACLSCTNNLAERDARMMRLRQKISGGFRSGPRRFRDPPPGYLNREETRLGYHAQHQ